MPTILTDAEILDLRNERKVLPADWGDRLDPKPRVNSASHHANYSLEGADGSRFRVFVRLNPRNELDFSVGLVFIDATGAEYVLVRYNGKHPSEHTNKLEKRNGVPDFSFRNVFHIHIATERYQRSPYPIDGFAAETTRYGSLESAMRAFLDDNGFAHPGDKPGQMKLPGA